MEIFLIRHTQVDIEKGVCYGQKDVELAQSYAQEFQQVKKQLDGESFDMVYSSPLKRCKQLAMDLDLGQVVYDERLKELNFGDWEGKAWDDIADPAFPLWMDDFVNRKCTNGESFAILNQRVLAFWNELKTTTHTRVAVITHGGVIRTIQALLKGINLEDAFQETPAQFGEVIKVKV